MRIQKSREAELKLSVDRHELTSSFDAWESIGGWGYVVVAIWIVDMLE